MAPRSIVLSALLACSLPALAGSPSAIRKPVGEVEISGLVTVDLVADPSGGSDLLFWADTGSAEKPAPLLAQARTGSGESMIAPALVESLGLKKHKKSVGAVSYEVVVIDRIAVGGAVFSDVQAVVPKTWTGAHQLELSLPAAGLAWAQLPSQGKLHLAPAAQGAELLAMVSGSAQAFRRTEQHKVKYGKVKKWIAAAPFVMDGTVGGQAVSLVLGHEYLSNVSSAVPLQGPVRRTGDRFETWSSVEVGGVSLGSDWLQDESGWRMMAEGTGEPVLWSNVGGAFLNQVDIAYDPAGTAAFAPAARVVLADGRPALLEQAEKDLKACLEPEEPLSEEDAAKPAGERCAGPYGAVAGARADMGDLDGALAARTLLAEAAPSDCGAWQALGELRLQRGELTEAQAALAKSSELVHLWYAMDPWDRHDAQKDFDGLSDEEKDAATLRPQPSACLAVDAQLALAALAAGDRAAVAKIYDERLDMDPGLAAVYGAMLIVEDKVEEAHGPWRMVDHLTLSPSLSAKAGLARLFAQQGDWKSAEVNYRRALEIDAEDATVSVMWAQDMAAALGNAEALTQARAWMDQRPDSLAARLAVARLGRLAGQDNSALAAQADALFQARVAQSPANADLLATWARFQLDTGRIDQAAATLEAALKDHPQSAALWLAKAELHQLRGEVAPARGAFGRAVAAGGAHPGYALRIVDAGR